MWLDLGGILEEGSPPPYFRTTSPSAVHHCIVPRGELGVASFAMSDCIVHTKRQEDEIVSPHNGHSFPLWGKPSILLLAVVLCYRRGGGSSPDTPAPLNPIVRLHPNIWPFLPSCHGEM